MRGVFQPSWDKLDHRTLGYGGPPRQFEYRCGADITAEQRRILVDYCERYGCTQAEAIRYALTLLDSPTLGSFPPEPPT